MQITKYQILHRKIRKYFKDFFFLPLYWLLAINKRYQKALFEHLRSQIPEIYQKLINFDFHLFLTPFWKEKVEELEKIIIPLIPFSFLRIKMIAYTMFVSTGGDWLKKELNYLKEKIPERELKRILIEDYIGKPRLINAKYFTSHNSIHHLYHIIRFLKKTNCNIQNIHNIIEWGGGYGNLAKIFWRFCRKKKTYIIIDLPLMSCIQWLYLATIFGEQNVNLIQNSNSLIKKEKINLLPVSFLDKYELKADLFISTWALTESSKFSQDYVLDHKWFDSQHKLISYEYKSKQFPDNIIAKYFEKKDFIIEDIEFLRGHKYAFQ